MNLHYYAQVYVKSINDIITVFVVISEGRNFSNRDLVYRRKKVLPFCILYFFQLNSVLVDSVKCVEKNTMVHAVLTL